VDKAVVIFKHPRSKIANKKLIHRNIEACIHTQHTAHEQQGTKAHQDKISRHVFTTSHKTHKQQGKKVSSREKTTSKLTFHYLPTNQPATTPALQLAFLPSLCPSLLTYNAKPTNLYTHNHAHQSSEPSKPCPQQASYAYKRYQE
jgi:hypothetical protein